ncbi:hypothetical protein DPMN_004799 [Dreissena polymorpha]|uniref:Uncharacterized protein n=1 Tax=Dreissena polymorpha TaxID=45954 RepID=A0A9D4RW78_DREPO|nr:hypothetical protein DPMN_004799 [Dreissena polymorpha]
MDRIAHYGYFVFSAVKHTIDVGNHRPIKVPPRRVPKAFEGEEEKIIKQQLEAGVIRESNSPWIQDREQGSEQGVSPKGVEEELFGLKSSDIDTTLNVSDQFKSSLLVDHSPESIAKLQRNDPDVGYIIICEKETKDFRNIQSRFLSTECARIYLVHFL